MKNFNSNSWLLFIFTFFAYCTFIFYLIQQKAVGHALIENISSFNINLLLLSLAPFYLQRFNKNKKQDSIDSHQIISIHEEKKLRDQQQLKLQASQPLRIKAYLQSMYLAYLMAALMMSIILLLDK